MGRLFFMPYPFPLMALEDLVEELAGMVERGEVSSRGEWEEAKRGLAKKHRTPLPKDSLLLPRVAERVGWERLRPFTRKPVRTISGVAPVALMVRPQGSCRWSCIYCPLSPLAPKSYVGFEPSARRAREWRFHPFGQIKARLKQYRIQGHVPQKAEVIIQGGTFLAMEKGYREWFMRWLYYAFNDEWEESLERAKALNERARHRIVGLTIETRPDVAGRREVDEMLRYGATRVELGVQHPDDEIYRIVKRGHRVEDVVASTALLKDSAFKVVYHLMPGLPGSSVERDKRAFRRLFTQEGFMPDMLKIYPTLVVEGTELHRMWKEGEYQPYTVEEAVDVIVDLYRALPPWVRVMRVQRDIPSNLVAGGVKRSNLRELVEARLREEGIEPWEIRLREAGMRGKAPREVELVERRYRASSSEEVFLSYEDSEGTLYALLRLRRAGKPFRWEISPGDALVRELHVYGPQVPLGERGEVQHRGLGRKLLERAEEIAREWGSEKVVVISGPGVRDYYRRMGYHLVGAYMVKVL